MGFNDFLFGKVTYKGNPYLKRAAQEEVVELPSIGGAVYICFDDEGTTGLRFELPRGEYDFSILTEGKEHSLGHFRSTGDKPIATPLSVTLVQRAELVIKNQNDTEERIPLW